MQKIGLKVVSYLFNDSFIHTFIVLKLKLLYQTNVLIYYLAYEKLLLKQSQNKKKLCITLKRISQRGRQKLLNKHKT